MKIIQSSLESFLPKLSFLQEWFGKQKKRKEKKGEEATLLYILLILELKASSVNEVYVVQKRQSTMKNCEKGSVGKKLEKKKGLVASPSVCPSSKRELIAHLLLF